ncbi:related to DRPLA protein [Cephalotrichum gorgonifer]|uniref:Related to DRPLA protein n=1 Tax=Cephalotrichum gorgonifer TaxID=2041049 RepID=A0AAE8N112_9PEZI|nr:related to DRPLA protein [Cephalotrichum gorgonifer]
MGRRWQFLADHHRPITESTAGGFIFEKLATFARSPQDHDPNRSALFEIASALLQHRAGCITATVDIASLLEGSDSKESTASPRQRPRPPPLSSAFSGPPPTTAVTLYPTVAPATAYAPFTQYPAEAGIPPAPAPATESLRSRPRTMPPLTTTSMASKRSLGPHSAESPAKKQSKWSAEEDALIIELRGSGMKWEDISRRLPGRSAISCRLHYQNYLERRSEWDEERKNKLARLFKPEMWAKVAEEMAVPWRAAEAMHWQLGEAEMARRAGVVPFTLSSANAIDTPGHRRNSPPRGYTHAQPGNLPRDTGVSARYGRGHVVPLPPGRTMSGRQDSIPTRPSPLPPDAADRPPMTDLGPAPGLAPIHLPAVQGRGSGMLPGIAELTTGVSPFSTPAYSMGMHSISPVQSAGGSPYLSGASYYQPAEPGGSSKRPASPDSSYRETRPRRHMDLRYEEERRYVP